MTNEWNIAYINIRICSFWTKKKTVDFEFFCFDIALLSFSPFFTFDFRFIVIHLVQEFFHTHTYQRSPTKHFVLWIFYTCLYDIYFMWLYFKRIIFIIILFYLHSILVVSFFKLIFLYDFLCSFDKNISHAIATVTRQSNKSAQFHSDIALLWTCLLQSK